jgi:hypothetical protein
MHKERLSFFHRRLPRIGALFSFWWGKIGTPRAKDSHKKEASKYAKEKTKQSAKSNSGARKAYRMSGFLSILFLVVASVFAGIAVASWQKGGYRNYWIAFEWGIAAYVLLGIGAFFTYYYYVIRPARDAIDTTQGIAGAADQSHTTVNRAYLAYKEAQITDFVVGKRPIIQYRIENTGRTPAFNVVTQIHAELRRTPLPDNFELEPPEKIESVSVLPAGGGTWTRTVGNTPVTQKDVDDLKSGSTVLYILGRATYTDAFQNAQTLRLCVRYNPLYGTFEMCPQHNTST